MVDDELLICDVVKMMLDFDGHLVETVGCAKDALETLQASKFDLVITDFEMPGMKGDELAAAITARDPKQVVMLQLLPFRLRGLRFRQLIQLPGQGIDLLALLALHPLEVLL